MLITVNVNPTKNMNSPWINGSQGAGYSVPNLSAILTQGNQETMDSLSSVGQTAGSILSAIYGGFKGANNPEAFGAGTSATSGALQGAAMNFANAMSGGNVAGMAGFGPASSNMSGFAGLVSNAVNGGKGGVPTGSSFTQFEKMGKAADNFRSAMATTVPTTGNEQPKVLGYTDAEWKHIGTNDKIQALQGWQQAQQAKATMAGYDKAVADTAEAHARAGYYTSQQDALKSEQEGWQRFGQNYKKATAPQLNNDLTDFQNYGKLNSGTLNGQQMQDLAISSGVNAKDALLLAKGNMDLDKGAADLARQKTQNIPQDWMNPSTQRHYSIYGNTMIPSKSDEEIVKEAQSKAGSVSGNARLHDVSNQLLTIYKTTPHWQSKPDVMKKITALEAERNALISGGTPATAGAAPANGSDPLGLFGN